MWLLVRRFIAGIKLVVMIVFVLHSGAMAGLRAHSTVSHHAERDIYVDASAPSYHENGRDSAVVIASDTCAHGLGSGNHDGADATHNSHCGNVCGLVLPSVALSTTACPATADLLALISQVGTGVDPAGLKRPPRTLYIG